MAALTNIEVITAAFRAAQIIPVTGAPSAAQAAEALGKLNRMMNRLEQDDVYLQYFVQTSTADTFPCPEYTHQGVIGMLAVELCPNYGRSVPPELSNALGTGSADVGRQTILRKAMNDQLPRADLSYLPKGTGRWWYRDLTGDA